MKRAALVLAAVALLLGGVGQARANWISDGGGSGGGGGTGGQPGGADPQFFFTFSDTAGDVGFGTLNTVPSGQGDDSLWAMTGSLTVTGGALVGTYSLLPEGPGITNLISTAPPAGWSVDNLIYPANDAASGTHNPGLAGFPVIANPSYLTFFGLLFGAGSTEINIFGNGGGDYAFEFTTPSSGGIAGSFSGGTFQLAEVPEPSTLVLLGVGAVGLGVYGWRRWRKAVRV